MTREQLGVAGFFVLIGVAAYGFLRGMLVRPSGRWNDYSEGGDSGHYGGDGGHGGDGGGH